MPEWLIPVLGLGGVALTTVGLIVGYVISARTARQTAALQAAATAKAAEETEAHRMIDQLQEELKGYRAHTDARLEKLETENTAYRRFVFQLIDHCNAHGITPLPWPDDIPR